MLSTTRVVQLRTKDLLHALHQHMLVVLTSDVAKL